MRPRGAGTKQITVQTVSGCTAVPDSWQFRGTPNAWGTTATTPVAGTFQTVQSYAAVGLAASSAQSFTVTGVRNGTSRDAVTGATVTVGNGTLSFTVNASSAGVYVLDGPGKIGVDGDFLR